MLFHCRSAQPKGEFLSGSREIEFAVGVLVVVLRLAIPLPVMVLCPGLTTGLLTECEWGACGPAAACKLVLSETREDWLVVWGVNQFR